MSKTKGQNYIQVLASSAELAIKDFSMGDPQKSNYLTLQVFYLLK